MAYPAASPRSGTVPPAQLEQQRRGIDAAVVPFGVRREDFAHAFPQICRFTNVIGALITMPHKIAVVEMIDEVSTAVQIAGSCNAVLRSADGRLIRDMFDGEGFVRGVASNGGSLFGKRLLIVGAGGVGSAIAASSAAQGPAEIALYDVDGAAMDSLADRLREAYPLLKVSTGSNDPSGSDVVVNATPLGMKPGDPMPLDVTRLAPDLRRGGRDETGDDRLSRRGAERGCQTQVGVDMLFEQIPSLSRVFRLSAGDARRTESGRAGRLLNRRQTTQREENQ